MATPRSRGNKSASVGPSGRTGGAELDGFFFVFFFLALAFEAAALGAVFLSSLRQALSPPAALFCGAAAACGAAEGPSVTIATGGDEVSFGL